MLQDQSNRPVYKYIIQTDQYVSMSVKLAYMWQNQSNRPVYKYIIQTDQYVTISVKLTRMWLY